MGAICRKQCGGQDHLAGWQSPAAAVYAAFGRRRDNRVGMGQVRQVYRANFRNGGKTEQGSKGKGGGKREGFHRKLQFRLESSNQTNNLVQIRRSKMNLRVHKCTLPFPIPEID